MALHLSTSSSRLTGSIRAVAFTLVGIALIEFAAGLVLPESLMIHYFRHARASVAGTSGVAVQVMGDSVARTAIWAHRLEETMPDRKFENYALGGSGPVFSYLLLRDQVAAGNTPEYVIYAHSPHTYSGVRFPVLVGSFCTWGEIGEILATGHETTEIAFGVMNRLFYTLRYRDQIKGALRGDLSFFQGERKTVFGQDLFALENASVVRHDFATPLTRTQTDPFTVSELNRLYLDRFLTLAEEHNVTVLWVTMPLSKKVLDARTVSGFVPAYYAFVDSIAARGVTVLQKEFLVLDDPHFADYSHVNVEGGMHFTDHISGRLRDHLAIRTGAPALSAP